MMRSWEVASDLPPFDLRPLLPAERAELLRLLEGLGSSDWRRDTACPGWSVHDIALHLLGDDVGRLGPVATSEARQGKVDFRALASLIEGSNEDWVRATRRIPPSLLIELLALTGARVDAAFAGLDLWAEGVAVGWSGGGPTPWWLDIAREYTERWVHHQQIRLAVGRRVLSGRRWLHPVLAAFMRSLPMAYESIAAPTGTQIAVVVQGPAGGRWLLRRDEERWRLVDDGPGAVASEIRMSQDLAWRLLTRMVAVDEALPAITISGDRDLGIPSTRAVAIMTTRL